MKNQLTSRFILSVQVRFSTEGDGWIVLTEDNLGNRQVVGGTYCTVDEALTAAMRLGGPPVTLSNQSVIDRLPPRYERASLF